MSLLKVSAIIFWLIVGTGSVLVGSLMLWGWARWDGKKVLRLNRKAFTEQQMKNPYEWHRCWWCPWCFHRWQARISPRGETDGVGFWEYRRWKS